VSNGTFNAQMPVYKYCAPLALGVLVELAIASNTYLQILRASGARLPVKIAIALAM